jgi:hypothetical protein
MKCIKSIKATKNTEIGTIKRVNDKEADSDVRGGYWKYVPKSEWKSNTGKTKNIEETTNVETPKKKKNEKNSK